MTTADDEAIYIIYKQAVIHQSVYQKHQLPVEYIEPN